MKLYLHVCCSACRVSRSSDVLPSFPPDIYMTLLFGGQRNKSRTQFCVSRTFARRKLAYWTDVWRRATPPLCGGGVTNSNWTTPSLPGSPRSLPIDAWYANATYLHTLRCKAFYASIYVAAIWRYFCVHFTKTSKTDVLDGCMMLFFMQPYKSLFSVFFKACFFSKNSSC